MIPQNGDNTPPKDPSLGESTHAEQPQRPFRLPPHRTFVVRKYNAARTALVETIVRAHRIQIAESGRTDFIDFEIDAELGPTTRLHRVIFNVEDVEDIDRVSPPSQYLITH